MGAVDTSKEAVADPLLLRQPSLDREGPQAEPQLPAPGPRSAVLPGRGLGKGGRVEGEGLRVGFPAANASGAEAGRFCASWGPAVGGAQRWDASWGPGGQRLPANSSGGGLSGLPGPARRLHVADGKVAILKS